MTRTGFILAVESYLVRKGLVAILNRIPGTMVIKEFDAAPPLLDYMKNHHSGFLVLSQSIFDNVTELFLSNSRLLEKIILVSDLPGDHNSKDVLATIHTGESKEPIIGKIMKIMESQPEQPAGSNLLELTRREKTIVRLVAMGLTNKQIAGELFLSAHTVITHRKNINSKLGIKSVSGLTIYAIVNNIITIEEVTSKPDQ
jgi:DNA-binding NarL/FixJ family response regulator